MNAWQQQQQVYLCPTLTNLHDTKKLDKNIDGVQASHNNHLGLKR